MILRHRIRFKTRALICLLSGAAVLSAVSAGVASAKIFASQEQALAEAFPDASRIDRETVLLLKKDAEKISALIHEEVTSKVVVLHTAYSGEKVIGYAQIDVHNVRTKPEALMIVLTADGAIRSVRVLAFHEPLDYMPTDRWYTQFEGRSKQEGLRVGRGIHAVVGATLSARAATDGVRRMLAYWEVLLKPAELRTEAP
jgi:Na+-translocating ferredoxin:NAD+ oxidoreductase RnfG subunit